MTALLNVQPFAPRPSDLVGAAYVCATLDIDRATLVRRIAAGKVAPQPVAKLDGPNGAYVFLKTDVHNAKADQDKQPSSVSEGDR